MPQEYNLILIFMLIAGGLSCFLVTLPLVLSRITKTHKPYYEKLSPYECGFNPIGENVPTNFNIKFYLVAIIFVIFDLEIAFLFPWAVVLRQIGFAGYISMMIFLLILTLGFVYEWNKGALDW